MSATPNRYKNLWPLHFDATTAMPLAQILSNYDIVKWLAVIPKGYTVQDAEAWLKPSTESANTAIKELEEAEDGASRFVETMPIRLLREVHVDGTQILIGSVGVSRSEFTYLEDEAEGKRLARENAEREIGDPEIVWEMGDYLAASHHGRGIMTAAIGALIREWIVPRMGARHILAAPYLGNAGSVRVFEKNGFIRKGTTRKEIINSGGKRHEGQHVMQCVSILRT